MRVVERLVLLLLLLLPLTAWSETAPAPWHEQVIDVPGNPAHPVRLQVTLFTPDGPGPFPLAVMNHGADKAAANNRGERFGLNYAALYFLQRGYAVAQPMMRGFAGSGGKMWVDGCNLSGVGEENGRDIDAVIVNLARRQMIDGSRVVVAGQSFGGWNTMGVGADPAPGVRGLVMFNAALRSSSCPIQDRAMIDTASRMGALNRLPSLWFYGDNDTLMPTATWHAVFNSFGRGGSHSELVDIGSFGEDSHQFLGSRDSFKLWVPRLDAFLTRIGMPAGLVGVPAPAPAPAHGTPQRIARAVPMNAPATLAGFSSVGATCAARGVPRLVVTEPPQHGSATVAERPVHPAFPPGSALVTCNTTAVPGAVLTYVPAPGYSGQDGVTVDETNPEGVHHLVRFMVTVAGARAPGG